MYLSFKHCRGLPHFPCHQPAGGQDSPAQWAAHGTGEHQCARLVLDEHRQVSAQAGMIASGIPAMRRPAFDLGGPRNISAVERST
jgi:hypothetical protein